MNDIVNYIIIIFGAGVALFGVFGKCFDDVKAKQVPLRQIWKLATCVTYLGWVVLFCTAGTITGGILKYQSDREDTKTKEARALKKELANEVEARAREKKLGEERDEWQTKAQVRDAWERDSFEKLGAHSLALEEENKKLKDSLKDLQDRSTKIIKAIGTTSGAVAEARDALDSEVKRTKEIMSHETVESKNLLFNLISEMHVKHVQPMHAKIDDRGKSDDDLPTLGNVRLECTNPVELTAALKNVATAESVTAAIQQVGKCAPCLCGPGSMPTASASGTVVGPSAQPSAASSGH